MSTRTDDFLESYPPESHSWAGKVAFGLSYPSHGWIQLVITCTAYVQNVVVYCSNVFNPFPALIDWLNKIAEGNLPCETMIDEEGHGKTLRASPVNEDEFLFEILRWPWRKDSPETPPTFLYVQVNRRQFLSEFLKRWDDFFVNQYDPAEWEQYGSDLRKLDVSKVRRFVEGK